MRPIACSTLIALAVSVVAASHASTYVDDFEDGANPSGWSFNSASPDIIEATGGNPGAWLHNPGLVTFAPIATTTWHADTPFLGDYRARHVSAVSIDARTDWIEWGSAEFPFALVLRDTNGTPGYVQDDDYAYYVDEAVIVPQPGEGWLHYQIEIPSQFADPVPPGWSGGWVGDLEHFRPGVEWSDVITSVDRVEFWWIHPAWFAIIQGWDVGIDNVSITSGSALPGDIDGDGDVDLADLATLLAAYDTCAGDPGYNPDADIDGSGCVDLADLATLLANYGTGA